MIGVATMFTCFTERPNPKSTCFTLHTADRHSAFGVLKITPARRKMLFLTNELAKKAEITILSAREKTRPERGM